MKKQKVDYKYLPPRVPLVDTCVAYLILKHFNANGIAYGITGTILALIWLGFVLDVVQSEFKHPLRMHKSLFTEKGGKNGRN